jgi:NADP-dependent 3-hydroxy acid dehydrogenase YdfG
VVLCARSRGEIDAGAEAIRLRGGGAQVLVLDVMDRSAAAQIEALGPFDILVNNAGTKRPRRFAD